jgi:4-hydroxy-tetrahydrodipicolinate reductase
VKIAVAGALGRMGQAVTAGVKADPGLTLAARFDRPGAEGDELVLMEAALAAAEVVIDFTTPAASVALAQAAAAHGRPALVIGATGFEETHVAAIAEAAKRVPIVRSGNYSLGLNILMGLVERAAEIMPADAFDIEIFEAHHRRKVDAPSGTALMLGEAAARGRGEALKKLEKRVRDGITGERPRGEIGFSVMRGGGIVGEHKVVFAGEEESLTLQHVAWDRALFARGALAAAKWVADKPPGEYDMADVLGFRTRG